MTWNRQDITRGFGIRQQPILEEILHMAKWNRKNGEGGSSELKPSRLCSCGSGLKYENCCGADSKPIQVSPANKPEFIGHHLLSKDGGKTWEKKPGILCAIIGGIKPEDFDKPIHDLIQDAIDALGDLNNGEFKKKLLDCRHKLRAVKYHLSTIAVEIKERVKEYETNYSAGSGVSLEMENPRLVYETEAFLFQTKSGLDLLTQALGCMVAPLRSMRTFSKKNNQAGGKVIAALRRNGFEKLGNLFEEHRLEWIQELVEMRDTITHYSELKGFRCFVEHPYMGGKTVSIHYPSMPSGEKVDVYSQNIYNRLLELYRSALKIVIDQEQ
jgi:SEC-C motif